MQKLQPSDRPWQLTPSLPPPPAASLPSSLSSASAAPSLPSTGINLPVNRDLDSHGARLTAASRARPQ
eukprot:705664-Rhodomonas_salina.1